MSDAEWITDETRLAELRREDAPLAYTERPEALATKIEQLAEHVELWDIPDSDIVRIAPDRYPNPVHWASIKMGELRNMIRLSRAASDLLAVAQAVVSGFAPPVDIRDAARAAIAKVEESGPAVSPSTTRSRSKNKEIELPPSCEPGQHVPVIIHRTGGKDARYFNTCGKCGRQIQRGENSPWVAIEKEEK